MDNLSHDDAMTGNPITAQRIKIRMLQQMAEALEDEALGMDRRVVAFEDEEFSLNREIEEWQTQINRLSLKLEGLRAERNRVIEKIESLRAEAAALREEAFTGEEEIAISLIDGDTARLGESAAVMDLRAEEESHSRGSTYFRRMTLENHAR